MKKSICLFLIIFLVTSVFVGCSSTSPSAANNTEDITTITSETKKEDTAQNEGKDPDFGAPEQIDVVEKHPTTIEEQVIVDQNGIKITAKEYVVDPTWGDGIKLLIENETDVAVTVSCRGLIVNNYVVNSLFVETVAAGKKANATLDFPTTDLKSAGITSVGLVEVMFHIYDDDTYDDILDAGFLTIKTSDFDNMEVVRNDSGTELFNSDGIRIVGKYVDEDDIWGTAVLLYLENSTDKDLWISADNMSINGYMVQEVFSTTLFAGKMAIDDITVFSSDLEENDIETIEEIEMTFVIRDADTYDTITETEPVVFQVGR